MVNSQGASPGGPALSSVKKRRLAALTQAYSGKSETSAGPASKSQVFKQNARNTSTTSGSTRTSGSEAAKAQEYPYSPLPQHILTGAVGNTLLSSAIAASSGAATDDYKPGLEGFLEVALSAAGVSDAPRAIKSRVHGQTLLLDNPSKQPNAAAALKRRGGLAAGEKLMSGRQRKALLGGPKQALAGVRYERDLLPLNQRWLQYVEQLLQPAAGAEERILQAELTGCQLLVVHCRQKSLEGLHGIVALSTRSAFHVITPEDRHRVLPKEGCVVQLQLGAGRIATLVGSNLLAAQRKQPPGRVPFPI